MDLCRLCYSRTYPKKRQNIFNERFTPPLWKIIADCSNLEITRDDPYTKVICVHCFVGLKNFYKFRQMMLNTDYRIRQDHCNNNKNNNNDCSPIKTDSNVSILGETSSNIEDGIEKNHKISHSDVTNVINNANKSRNAHELKNDTNTIDNNKNNPTNNIHHEMIKSKLLKKQHQCSVCKQSFAKLADLEYHLVRHIDKKEYVWGTYDKGLVRNNESNKRIGEKQHRCQLCEKQFALKAHLLAHLNLHNKKESFHQIGNESNNDGQNRVNYNDKKSDNVATGVIQQHSQISDEIDKNCNVTNNNAIINDNNRIAVDQNEIKSKESSHNEGGTDNDKNPAKADDQAETIVDPNVLKEESIKIEEDSIKIEHCYCNETIDYKPDYYYIVKEEMIEIERHPVKIEDQIENNTCLQLQSKEAADVNLFKCDTCGKQFSNTHKLNYHLAVHTKPYQCDICGKRFSVNRSLQAHLRWHTGEHPYSCSTCGKRFRCYVTLGKHLKLHSGEKQHLCHVCGEKFSTRSILNRHSAVHTGRKSHQCNVCGKKFAAPNEVKKHSIVHTGEQPYGCKVCGKRFSRKDNLKTHSKIHTGEKPYKCNFCDRRFLYKQVLKEHLKSHTNGKSFDCNKCDIKFSKKSDLSVHLKQKHKKK